MKPFDRRLIAALLAAPLLFFWPLFVPVPGIQRTLIAGDTLYMYFPQRVYVARELWQGRLPLWNPYIFAGQPGLYDMQLAVFYPITWLTSLLGGPGGPPWWLVQLEMLLHLGLAGLFMFLLMRRLLGTTLPALVAAVAYMLGGYLTTWPLNQLAMLESSIWLPLVLWLIDLASVRGVRYYALAGIAWAVEFFAGHPQPPLYALYVAGAFILWRAVFPARDEPEVLPPRRRAVRGLAGLLTFAVIALGLAAVQILPARDIERQSLHPSISLEEQAHGLAPAEIGALLVPLHWGNPAAYTGMLPLALALFALAVPASLRAAQRDRWLWALVAAASLILAFGGATPLYWLARAVAPGFTLIRNQERVLGVWSLAVAMLAGYGVAGLLDARLGRRTTRIARLAALGLVLLAVPILLRGPLVMRAEDRPEVLALYTRSSLFAALAAGTLLVATMRQRPTPEATFSQAGGGQPGIDLRRPLPVRASSALSDRALAVLLLGLTVADLYLANGSYALSPGGDPAPLLQAVRFVRADPATPFRISSEGLLPGGGGAGMLYGLEDVVGTGSFEPAAYQDFWARVRTDTNEGTILALLNVKYILTRRNLPPIAGELTFAHQEGDLRLYRIEQPLPRAYVVYSATLAADTAAAAARLQAPDFDPRREVVLASGHAGAAPGAGGEMTTVQLEIPAPTRWRIEAAPVADGWLVLSQRAYPGWHAYVDGQPATALGANLAFTAIPLTAGAHTVEWVFEPQAAWIGGAISLATLASGMVLLLAARPRGRPQ